MTAGPVMRGRRGRDRRVAASLAGSSGSGPGAGRRLPDLSALPALLAASGTFTDLRARLATRPGPTGAADGDALRGRRTGRHVGLVAVPHGAKTFLAATLAG